MTRSAADLPSADLAADLPSAAVRPTTTGRPAATVRPASTASAAQSSDRPAASPPTPFDRTRPGTSRPAGAWLRSALVWYPFTPLGSLLFVAATYLLGSAFAGGSPYEFVLAIAAYLALLVLAGVGRLQAYRFALADFEWSSSTSLHARSAAEHTLSTRTEQAKLFFRIHFGVWWRLRIGHRATLVGYREASGTGGVLSLSFYLPAAGAVTMRGRVVVRDVFGLCRAQLRPAERRDLTVVPALLGDQSAPPVDISVGFDTTQRAKTADEEKYFMREYMAGDRMKDINWKATSRLNEMITRISPVTQERTQLLHVALRPYVAAPPGTSTHAAGAAQPGRRENRDTVFHLDFAKSWLITFLRVIKLHHPEYTFVVDTGQALLDVLEMTDIDNLARHLANVRLQPGGSRGFSGAGASPSGPRMGDLFVFSTAFDDDLDHFIGTSGAHRTHVFRTAVAAGAASAVGADEDPSKRDRYQLCVNDAALPGTFGGRWLWSSEPAGRGRPRRVGRAAAHTEAGPMPNPRPISATSLDEQPLRVRYTCTPSS